MWQQLRLAATRSLQQNPGTRNKIRTAISLRTYTTTSTEEENIGNKRLDVETHRNGTTYVEEEVAKFRAMADSWWDPQGDCKPLHSLNRLRVSMVRDGLIQSGVVGAEYANGPKPLTGLRILDVGCGGGILCEPLGRLGANVVGLDAAEENVTVAQLHAESSQILSENLRYICGTIEEHAASVQEGYDAVIASEVLEHVEATDLFINVCSEVVKPGGSVFITTINKTPFSRVGAILIAEYVLRLLPPGTHDWNKFINRQELLFMLEQNGLTTRLVHGMGYNPFTNKWFWQSDTNVNYAVHAIKQQTASV